MKISFKRKSQVFHVGTLRSDLRKNNNYEGFGLCVSECPDEWIRICKLGGLPTHRLDKDDGVFADYYSVDKHVLASWAIESGFVTNVSAYNVHFVDAETDEDCFMTFENWEDANAEAESYDTDVVTVEVPIPSSKMYEHFGFEVERSSALEYALQIFVEENHPDVDGVWFDNSCNGHYSAPSGVIFENKVKSWTIDKIN